MMRISFTFNDHQDEVQLLAKCAVTKMLMRFEPFDRHDGRRKFQPIETLKDSPILDNVMPLLQILWINSTTESHQGCQDLTKRTKKNLKLKKLVSVSQRDVRLPYYLPSIKFLPPEIRLLPLRFQQF